MLCKQPLETWFVGCVYVFVCVSHTMSRSSWFWLCLIRLPQLSWATHIQATPLEWTNRLRYSVAGATKDHLIQDGPVRRCSELSRGWRISLCEKSSDWEKRVFDIAIQWNKQDNDGQWHKIRIDSEWIVNWLIDVDRDLVMPWRCLFGGSSVQSIQTMAFQFRSKSTKQFRSKYTHHGVSKLGHWHSGIEGRCAPLTICRCRGCLWPVAWQEIFPVWMQVWSH